VLGLMGGSDYLPKNYSEFFDGSYYFQMSGTSQATAVTSGIVALILQAQPSLTPDQVKCKLISSARPAVKSDGTLAYSVFQQGFGMVDAALALVNPYTTCANQGLDVNADLRNNKHFAGPARQNASGTYYVVDANGNAVGGSGYLWSNGYLWSQSSVAPTTTSVTTNTMVPQE
jgi:subtilisin family serine protease